MAGLVLMNYDRLIAFARLGQALGGERRGSAPCGWVLIGFGFGAPLELDQRIDDISMCTTACTTCMYVAIRAVVSLGGATVNTHAVVYLKLWCTYRSPAAHHSRITCVLSRQHVIIIVTTMPLGLSDSTLNSSNDLQEPTG